MQNGPTPKLAAGPKNIATRSDQLIKLLLDNLIQRLEEEPDIKVNFLHLVIIKTTMPYRDILGRDILKDFLGELKKEISRTYKEYKVSWDDNYFSEFKIVPARKGLQIPWKSNNTPETIANFKSLLKTAAVTRASERAYILTVRLSMLQDKYTEKRHK